VADLFRTFWPNRQLLSKLYNEYSLCTLVALVSGSDQLCLSACRQFLSPSVASLVSSWSRGPSEPYAGAPLR
jgi:hypothetical protein